MFLYKISFPAHLTTKCYIGITTQNISRRFNQHCNHKTSLISRAINKYGRNNAKIDMLLIAYDIKSLYEAEEKAIVKFNSIAPHGYNLSIGGESHSRGVSQSEETKSKRALKLIGQKRTAEQKARMSIAAKNITDEKRNKLSVANTGKKRSEEIKAKLSLARKNISEETRKKMSDSAKKIVRKIGEQNKASRKYICISPDGKEHIVIGLNQFCKEQNIHAASMHKAANRKGNKYKEWVCRHA